jgi:hypothetical protein
MDCEVVPIRTAGISSVEVFEMIDVLSQGDPGIELGWEAGSLCPRRQKLQ